MVRPIGRFGDGQSPLLHGQRLGGSPKAAQGKTEVVQADGGLRAFRPESGLGDRTCEDLQAFPDAGYRITFSVHPSAL